jgi:hypothetical protein
MGQDFDGAQLNALNYYNASDLLEMTKFYANVI